MSINVPNPPPRRGPNARRLWTEYLDSLRTMLSSDLRKDIKASVQFQLDIAEGVLEQIEDSASAVERHAYSHSHG